MSVLEITSLRLNGIVDSYFIVCAEVPAKKDSMGMLAFKGDPNVPDRFYIDNIQKTITLQFPWDLLDRQRPAITRDGIMGVSTQKALQDIKRIATEINNTTALEAIRKIEAGDLRDGASELWDASREIEKILKTDNKYFEETGEDPGWSYQKKLQYINSSVYPIYFPKPWQAKNMCSSVSGGDKYGIFTKIPESEEEFRSCQTPTFNHFLMWGPECPGCGINSLDPRFLRIKSRYPSAFTYEKIRERTANHIWSPVIPSPGFMPYVAAPPEGTPYYSNPEDPHPETEGVRFFDRDDEAWYREYFKKYQQFKEKFESSATEYNERFFNMLPHKKTISRYDSPNEWSVSSYGRKEPLWPDGTVRPPAAQLKRIIQERGAGVGMAKPEVGPAIASIQHLAIRFRKIY